MGVAPESASIRVNMDRNRLPAGIIVSGLFTPVLVIL